IKNGLFFALMIFSQLFYAQSKQSVAKSAPPKTAAAAKPTPKPLAKVTAKPVAKPVASKKNVAVAQNAAKKPITPVAKTDPPTSFLKYKSQKTAIVSHAAVAAAHPLATAAGIATLKKGGNAVDAAIAVQLALAVVYPRAGNIGGGGFLVYRAANGEANTLDFREKAPAKATRDMYLDDAGNVVGSLSQKGHLAAGIPGTIDGCIKMFQKYSKLKDWKKLVQPAIDLAEKGFAITALEATRLNENKAEFEKHSTQGIGAFAKKDGSAWKTGDVLKQPDLAQTLKQIAAKGRAGFYEGEVAQKIVAEMKRGKGIISLEDLKNYESKWRKPLTGKYRGYDMICMPPPSSGGVALLQLLGIVEPHPIATYGFQSAKMMHLFVEAERRVFADRSKHVGDPDFYKVETAKMLNPAYLKQRMSDFNEAKATPSQEIEAGKFLAHASEQTTHMSIVDAFGNAVSLTTTLNDNYGCRTIVGGAGFILNNEMDDFSAKPGVPNLYGAIGGEANAIAPHKTMLSSMTPTIVTKNGKLFMVVGTPGGTTIITSVFQTIVNVIDFKMTATEATHANRFHAQWLPDKVFIEKTRKYDASAIAKLKAMGHSIQERGTIGLVETIVVRPDGKLEAAADNRSDDDARGY
ncbi:MAG: hypothetical protein RL757_1519, partial [Bacteroidota bacterium]